jgi:hypothetical protein
MASDSEFPEQFQISDSIDWESPLESVQLDVELPFWLFASPGVVAINWHGVALAVEICGPWNEIFVGEYTDSRTTRVYEGPTPDEELEPTPGPGVPVWMRRHAKTVLRLQALAHLDALSDGSLNGPRAIYRASLCEAHIQIVNELVRRYRLATYDCFSYEVSPWDVPIWTIKHGEAGFLSVLVPYKGWDMKPTFVGIDASGSAPLEAREFELTSRAVLSSLNSDRATPGELDLQDANSLMERGDYTGAVRRIVSALEAVTEWALDAELRRRYPVAEAGERLRKTDLDAPGRLRQWSRLTGASLSDGEFEEYETARALRSDIVHRARRLGPDERGMAQRAVDTGTWLFSRIEQDPDRRARREQALISSVGRGGIALRFPVRPGPFGYVVEAPSS